MEDCLAPEQSFFTVAPYLWLESTNDLSHLDVASVKYLIYMFFGCKSLKELVLDGWSLSEDTKTDWMFEGCPSGIGVEGLKGMATSRSVF